MYFEPRPVALRPIPARPFMPVSMFSGAGHNGFINFRQNPTLPQFKGFVTIGEPPAYGARTVQLRTRSGEVVASTRSHPVTGAFEFKGWFPKRDDYVLHVLGDDYVDRSFPTEAPFAVQWNGNPKVNDSTVP